MQNTQQDGALISRGPSEFEATDHTGNKITGKLGRYKSADGKTYQTIDWSDGFRTFHCPDGKPVVLEEEAGQ